MVRIIKMINYKINHYQNTWILCGNTLLLDNALERIELKNDMYHDAHFFVSYIDRSSTYSIVMATIQLNEYLREWLE